MAKTRNAATVLGCKSRQEERCSPRTETDSHPIKLVVFDMSDLRCFLGRSLSQISVGKSCESTRWEQHTQKGLVSEKMRIMQWQLCYIL